MNHPERGQHGDEDTVTPLEGSPAGDQRALDTLIAEMKAQTESCDDARSDEDFLSQLMGRIDAGETPRFPLVLTPRREPTPEHKGQLILLGGFLLAAAAALLIWWQGPKASPPVAHTQPVISPVTPPAPSPFGTTIHVEAGAKPERASVEGLASWVFDAGSVAEVTQGTNRVDVRLERGAIEVDVIPQPVPERFVVIAGNSRVAVKGTRFRVARIDGRTEVDVEHGTVSVTSLAGPAPERLLVGPAAGSVAEVNPGEVTTRAFRPFGVSQAMSPSATALVENHPSPQRLPPTKGEETHPHRDQATLRTNATDLASRCFQENSRPSPNVVVSVSRTLVLDVAPGGTASSFLFDPPLSPATERCFTAGLAGLQGPSGRHTFNLELVGRR